MPTEHRYESFAALEQALLHWSQDLLHETLRHQQRISLLLSGGNTPLPFYRALAKTALPWQRTEVALVDERWVDTTDVMSNERAIRAAFADNALILRKGTGRNRAYLLNCFNRGDADHASRRKRTRPLEELQAV